MCSAEQMLHRRTGVAVKWLVGFLVTWWAAWNVIVTGRFGRRAALLASPSAMQWPRGRLCAGYKCRAGLGAWRRRVDNHSMCAGIMEDGYGNWACDIVDGLMES
jgi:hypothetical protein